MRACAGNWKRSNPARDGDRGVKCGRTEDEADVAPVPHPREHLLARERKVEDRDERGLGAEFHAGQHAHHGGHDDDHDEWRHIALRLLVALGEQRDREQQRREKQRYGRDHRKHPQDTCRIDDRDEATASPSAGCRGFAPAHHQGTARDDRDRG